ARSSGVGSNGTARRASTRRWRVMRSLRRLLAEGPQHSVYDMVTISRLGSCLRREIQCVEELVGCHEVAASLSLEEVLDEALGPEQRVCAEMSLHHTFELLAVGWRHVESKTPSQKCRRELPFAVAGDDYDREGMAAHTPMSNVHAVARG